MTEKAFVRGELCNLSEEVYTLSPECRWKGYEGLRVRLMSEGSAEPGHHFDPEWASVVLLNEEELLLRIMPGADPGQEAARKWLKGKSFLRIGVPKASLIPAPTLREQLLSDAFEED